MNRLYRYARHNRVARLLVGTLVIFFLYQGVTGEQQGTLEQPQRWIPTAHAKLIVSQLTEQPTDKLIKLARTDHIALLKWALDNYQDRIQDYRLTFLKQERINGKLKRTEKIAVKFKQAPYSVLMEWQKNPGAIDKLLYVEGANDEKMVVHPTGLWSFIKSVKRDPRVAEVRRSSRGTCDQFGFYRTMKNLLAMYELAQEQGDLQIRYLGETEVHGRPCVAMERLLPPKEQYPYGRLVMEFDKEYLLPIAITCYDWQDKLLSQYKFTQVRFNTGLTTAAFTPSANKL